MNRYFFSSGLYKDFIIFVGRHILRGVRFGSLWKSNSVRIVHNMANYNVLFVLGGPGAGKGTQCERIVEVCTTFVHINVKISESQKNYQ